MHAWWYEKSGAARDVLQYGEMEQASLGTDEVLVKIHVSAVNPTDVKRREAGRELGQFPIIIPNNDGSGVIEAVGTDVSYDRIGERVWLFGAQAGRPFGTAAEYCVLPSRQARHLPDSASFADGACLGVPAVTAHRGCFADGHIDGKTILITGGTGRVGQYAVQMAKLAGATVIATAGSPDKADKTRKLGADYVVNYREQNIADAVKELTNGSGVDRFIDVAFGQNIADVPNLVKPNGVVTSYGSDAVAKPEIPFLSLMYANILVRPFAIFAMPAHAQDAAFKAVEEWLDQGQLKHATGRSLGFDALISAHEMIGNGEVEGNCLINVC